MAAPFLSTANAALRRVPSWTLFAAAMAWAAVLFARGVSGALGPDPVAALTASSGSWALGLLVVGLWLSPIQRRLGLRVARFRRVVGLAAFAFAALHLSVWAVLDLGLDLARLASEVGRRPFLALGMGAFVLLVPLAATSFNAAIRRLGPARWRALHRLVYLAAVVALVHFVMGSKVWRTDQIVWMALLAAALGERLVGAAWARLAVRVPS